MANPAAASDAELTRFAIDEQLMRMSDGGLIHADDALGSPKVATLISIFVPGGGQVALGQTVKGLAIMGVWALCVFFIFLMRQDVEALIRTSSGGGRVNYLVILPILTAFILHISSIMGCASAAKRHERRTFDRPRPPMDLPFE